jgi:hypothetical protein
VGFWDVRIADLEARGEYFTDDDVRCLEEGGRVLHLHPLETPDYEVRDWLTYPGTQEIVMLPELADVYGPRSPGPDWLRKAEGGPYLSTAHYLDVNFEYHGGRPAWTGYPRFIGECSHEHYMCDSRCEDLNAFAYWNCLPVTGEYEEMLAKQIVHASIQMLDTALYPQVEWVTRMAYEGDYDFADPWLFWYHRDRMKAQDADYLLEAMDASFGNYAEEAMKEQADMFKDLYDARIVDIEHPGLEDLAHGEPWGQMPFVPLEQMLWRESHYEAYAFYTKALARRQYALSWRPRIRNYRGISEDEVED